MKYRILFILGIAVVLIPYLGFPNSWKRVMFVISGIVITYTAYLLYKANKKNISQVKKIETYTDNKPEINNL